MCAELVHLPLEPTGNTEVCGLHVHDMELERIIMSEDSAVTDNMQPLHTCEHERSTYKDANLLTCVVYIHVIVICCVSI